MTEPDGVHGARSHPRRPIPVVLLLTCLAVAALCLPAATGAAGSLDVRVVDGADDAEEGPSGIVQLSSSDLELVYDDAYPPAGNQTVGVRFQRVEVPRGAAVSKAWVQFTAKDDGAGACSLRVRGEGTADSSRFVRITRNISARALTGAVVAWDPPAWDAGAAGAAQRTPDLSPVIREIVGRAGWNQGNSLAIVISGDGLRRAWSYDGESGSSPLLHVEWEGGNASHAPATRAPVTSPDRATASPGNTSATVNAAIDNLVATGVRFLELPLIVLLSVAGLVGAVVGLLIVRLGAAKGARRVRWVLAALVMAAVLGAVAWIVDRKVLALQTEVRELRSKVRTDAIGLVDIVTERSVRRKAFLFDAAAAESGLRAAFGSVRMFPLVYDEATDVALVRLAAPMAQAYLAIVDLEHPGVTVKIGATIDRKRLTSEFAHENNCSVAINGEAGRSPRADSGFGEWVGNLICAGEAVLLEDTAERPFLSFDRRNHATYSRAAVVDRAASPEKYNVIWGRWDALVAGAVVTGSASDRQPRTAMAINRNGNRLYLLVVDGRRPGYSLGLSREEAARLLRAFGAYDGMFCDEGGSSCIYLAKLGGISNVPADDRGQERPTYTHFGVTVEKGKQ